MSETIKTTPILSEEAVSVEIENTIATSLPTEAIQEAEPDETDDPSSEDELTRLREEVTQLRQTLSQKEAMEEQATLELGEFHRLFPETSVKQIPKQVWEQVEGGLPLSAAYALYEREIQLKALRADEINRRNAALSSGKAGKDAPREYFSPDEVRAMSQKQVHDNYAVIVESMKRWH